MLRKLSLRRIANIIAILIFIYQTITLTIDYLKYQTVIEMKTQTPLLESPSFSICIGSHSMPEVSQNQNIVEFFDKSILCLYKHSADKQIKTCPQFQKVESVTPFSHRCFTYFSRLSDNNVWIDYKSGKVDYITFLIQNEINTFALIHPNNTSPHFFNQNIEIINYSHNVIGYSTIFEKLLPSPYQTDCQILSNSQ